MRQITNTVLMVRPAGFGYNEETAASNHFQSTDGKGDSEIHEIALKEFDEVVKTLRAHDIDVLVVDDTKTPHTPDAIFPNNWLSTHENKVLITYAMRSPIRREELRDDVLRKLEDLYGYKKEYNFQHYIIEDGLALEGTGSMILDRENRIVYACLSSRTSIQLLAKFGILMNFKTVYFYATDSNDLPIYHTNVMMALGEELAIICLESIADEDERKKVEKQLKNTNKQIVEISLEQVNQFAGNMLEVRSNNMSRFMIMSNTAKKALTADQINSIEASSQIISVDIPVIEQYGGGSVRCMLAEVFKPYSQ